MIVWKEEQHRILAVCGDIDVGAVFRSTTGRYFRYRVWVGPTRNPADGGANSEEKAKQAVVDRFDKFLAAAKLQPVPVPPDDMPLIEQLGKATAEERQDWLLRCPLMLLARIGAQASEIFAKHGENWATIYIGEKVAQLHATRLAEAAE
ncbi:hypothetical protein [Agrobacterium tumefaciens]|uniref:hypothetical protein n=1 Tax=Agrobacterium tumefaciens TaxID=358 RepID=UPI00061879CD|nr:hypothetical protein [Agrobacterium tumefaciens]AKC07203.1 hypothetical protein Ach5_14270 [Agrobacterium tumefaciens]AYM67344.1 hypothetical protein AtA6_11270 [Agrobacterium tumefaciens]NIB54934.1 hypothetical protein [Agrobacterium tumefaciens]NSZ21651.1 hypothetical protein [Agrobacterium tumefaciens]QQE32546.1 hypothetical protein I6I05_11370 [Agrobacterium tumefaciens]